MATANNVITATFGTGREAKTRSLFQYDYGIILKFEGLELPNTYEVHFSNFEHMGQAVPVVGNANGVVVPQSVLANGNDVEAYLYLHTGNNDGETVYHVKIPVIPRAKPNYDMPTPEEMTVMQQLIADVGAATQAAEDAVEAIPGAISTAIAQNVDATLSVSGKAADAKKVGDELTDLKSDINEMNVVIGVPINISITSLGYFLSENLSTDSSNNSRGRTAIFTLPDGEFKLVANNKNYQYSLYEQVISEGTQTTTRVNENVWNTNDLVFTSHSDRNYRIMVRRSDQGTMISDDLSTITFTFSANDQDEADSAEPLHYFQHGVPIFTDKESMLQSAIDIAVNSNTIVFAVAADNHYNSFDSKDCLQPAYAKRMAKIAKNVGADFIVNLGDIIEGFNDYLPLADYHQQYVNSNRFLDMVLAYTGEEVPFMYCAGHHECYPISESDAVEATLNYGTPFAQNRAFKSSEMKPMAYGKAILARLNTASANHTGYRQFTGKVVDIVDPNSDVATLNGTGASLTYYFDVEKNSTTTRFLVVDGTFFGGQGYDPDTVSFVQTALQDAATNGYKVVVFNHIPLRWNEYRLGVSNNAKNEAAFIDALKNSGATILAYIHGHVHADNVVTAATEREDTFTYPYADIPFPMIAISCQRIYGSSGPYIGNYVTYGTRRVARYEGYCFDVVALHVDTGVLDFYRFGAGDSGTYPTRTVQGNLG